MERALYCKFDTLRSYCEDESSWQFKFLKSLPSIHVQIEEACQIPQSFEEYYEREERVSGTLAFIDNWNEKLQRPIIPIIDSSIDYSRIANCIFDGIVPPAEVRDLLGIEVLEKSFAPLQRHWFENIEKNKTFTWKAFFKQGKIPCSNSVVIMDRYLFKVGIKKNTSNNTESFLKWYERGGRNIVDILDAIIPSDFLGIYNVLVVFDDSQIEKHTKNQKYISVEEALNSVSLYIQSKLQHKRCKSINLEYLAIHDGINDQDLPKEGLSWDERMKNRYLKNLYKLTHDRRLITNYYMVNATHGWDATDKSFSTETQTLYFDAILSGIDNPDQMGIEWSIPINYVQNFVNSFVYQLNLAKIGSYKCFRFKENNLFPIGIDALENNVLLLSEYPVKPVKWDPMDRSFQRDITYKK